MFSNHFVTHFPQNAPAKKIWESVNISERYGQNFVAYFLGSPCISYISLSVIEHVPLCSPVSINHPHRHNNNISLLHNKRSLPRWLQTSQHSKFSRLNFSLSLDSNVNLPKLNTTDSASWDLALPSINISFSMTKSHLFQDSQIEPSREWLGLISTIRLYNAIHVGSHWKKTEQRTY